MSADEVLASSLWPWPDPLLKRDRSGLVLFVNAAFLQLYGGQVQDWCGKPLAGWPEPVRVGAQRFETRIGVAPNESVYDWVESVMADDNALAIARNVTIFMPISEPTPDFVPESASESASEPASEPVPEPIFADEPAFEPVFSPEPESEPEPEPEPVLAPQAEAATPDVPNLNLPELHGQEELQHTEPAPLEQPNALTEQAEPDMFADTADKRADEGAYDDNMAANPAPPVADQVMQEAQIQQPDMAPAQQLSPPAEPMPEPRSDTRMMERRALPIEDSTNILGSSWRDDVIAKAVGGAAPSEKMADDTMPGGEVMARVKPGEGLQILLAEDNAINALLTRTLLEAEGAVVDTVEDGALALAAVSNKKYDLIFMDMRMPNMDGLEATRKIRAFGYDRPIIALTANAFDDDRNACFDSGMNDFMTKPVSAEELTEIVSNWTKPDEQQKLAS